MTDIVDTIRNRKICLGGDSVHCARERIIISLLAVRALGRFMLGQMDAVARTHRGLGNMDRGVKA